MTIDRPRPDCTEEEYRAWLLQPREGGDMATFTPSDGGKRFRITATGEEGRLEGFPLADPGTAKEGEGILWIPEFGFHANHWEYVSRDEVEECADQFPFVEVEE